MAWALDHGHAVFTHDLDFGTLLALTRATGPSIIQVRTHDVLPERLHEMVARLVHLHEADLRQGAILTVDEARGRVRLLPLVPDHSG